MINREKSQNISECYSTLKLLVKASDKGVSTYEATKKYEVQGGLRTKGYIKRQWLSKEVQGVLELPSILENQKTLPLISIITVVFNGEKFIQNTIDSVLNQDYPNIEYIIIDGCSNDGTLDILHRYSEVIDLWVSEPDDSMYEALNKGIQLASGDIVACLNSDDIYANDNVVSAMVAEFTDDISGAYGNIINKYEGDERDDRYVRIFQVSFKDLLLSRHSTFLPQPTLFLRKKVYDKIGLFDTLYKYASDYDFILKILKRYKIKYVDLYVTVFRDHEGSITSTGKINNDRIDVILKHGYKSYPGIYRLFCYLFLWIKYKYINLVK
jgi:glycosyltransferase involved in cell wall biosynthesis